MRIRMSTTMGTMMPPCWVPLVPLEAFVSDPLDDPDLASVSGPPLGTVLAADDDCPDVGDFTAV